MGGSLQTRRDSCNVLSPDFISRSARGTDLEQQPAKVTLVQEQLTWCALSSCLSTILMYLKLLVAAC